MHEIKVRCAYADRKDNKSGKGKQIFVSSKDKGHINLCLINLWFKICIEIYNLKSTPPQNNDFKF